MALTLDQYNQQYVTYGQQYMTLLQNRYLASFMVGYGLYPYQIALNNLHGKIGTWDAAFLNKYGSGSDQYAIAVHWLRNQVENSYKLSNPNSVISLVAVQNIRDTLNITSITNDSPFFSDINLAINDLASYISTLINPWITYNNYIIKLNDWQNQINNMQFSVSAFFAQAVDDGVIPPPTDPEYNYQYGDILWKNFDYNVQNSGTFGKVATVALPAPQIATDHPTDYPVPVLPTDPPPPPPSESQTVDAVIITQPVPEVFTTESLTALMPPPETLDLSNYTPPPVETFSATGNFDVTGIDQTPTPTGIEDITVSNILSQNPIAIVIGTIDMTQAQTPPISEITKWKGEVVMLRSWNNDYNVILGNGFMTKDRAVRVTTIKILMTPSALNDAVDRESDAYRFKKLELQTTKLMLFKGEKGKATPISNSPIATTTKKSFQTLPPDEKTMTYFNFDEPVLLDADSKYFWAVQVVSPRVEIIKTPIYDNVAQVLNWDVQRNESYGVKLFISNDVALESSSIISRDGGQTWASPGLCFSPWAILGYSLDSDQAIKSVESEVSITATEQPESLISSQLSIPLDSNFRLTSLDLSIDHEAEPGLTKLMTQMPEQQAITPPTQQKSAAWMIGAAIGALMLMRR